MCPSSKTANWWPWSAFACTHPDTRRSVPSSASPCWNVWGSERRDARTLTGRLVEPAVHGGQFVDPIFLLAGILLVDNLAGGRDLDRPAIGHTIAKREVAAGQHLG